MNELISVEIPRSADIRRGRRLEYLTLGWNVIEAMTHLMKIAYHSRNLKRI